MNEEKLSRILLSIVTVATPNTTSGIPQGHILVRLGVNCFYVNPEKARIHERELHAVVAEIMSLRQSRQPISYDVVWASDDFSSPLTIYFLFVAGTFLGFWELVDEPEIGVMMNRERFPIITESDYTAP